MKLKIKWRIFLYLIAFTAVLLVLLWLLQTVFLDQFYEYIKTSQTVNSAATIARNIESDDLDEIIAAQSNNYEACILIIDRYGTIRHSAESGRKCIIHNIPEQQLIRFYEIAAKHGGEYMENYDSLRNEAEQGGMPAGQSPKPDIRGYIPTSLIYSQIVVDSNQKEYTIIVNTALTPVDSTVLTIRSQLKIVTFIMVTAAFVIAILLSRRVAKPITNITAASKELAKGDYSIAFKTDGDREIAELAETLNYARIELGRVNDLQRELIANISHDLRTPLTMITGYAEVMRDLPGENTAENLQIIIDEADRLTSLVSDVLDISKLTSGTQALDIRRINLTQCILEVIARYNQLVKQDALRLHFSYQGEAFINADEVRLLQVIYNLINNAISYTGEDNTVYVNQIIHGDKVRIEIIDTGAGISADKIGDIWDRYYKIDGAHRRAQRGSGLGLSIVKSILEQHRAEFGVTSQLGVGSNFWFCFPLAEAE